MPNQETIYNWNDVVKPNTHKTNRSDLMQQLSAINAVIQQLTTEQSFLETKLADLEAHLTQKIVFPEEPIMVALKGGTFKMSHTSDWNIRPVREVTLSPFSMGKYQITQAQWVAIMGSNPSEFEGESLPVENVNWHQANEYVFRLSQKTGKKYRLPTEAEWEYAANGGQYYDYPGDNNMDEVGWHNGISQGRIQPVGLKKPNAFGLYDMAGNVWEWCSDWQGSYNNDAVTNPIGAISGQNRVIRGVSWKDNKSPGGRVLYRGAWAASNKENHVGFRVVLTE